LSKRRSLIIHKDIQIEVQKELENNRYESIKKTERNDIKRKSIKIENNKEFILSMSHNDRKSLLLRNSSKDLSLREQFEDMKNKEFDNEELLNNDTLYEMNITVPSFLVANNLEAGAGNEDLIGPIVIGNISKNDPSSITIKSKKENKRRINLNNNKIVKKLKTEIKSEQTKQNKSNVRNIQNSKLIIKKEIPKLTKVETNKSQFELKEPISITSKRVESIDKIRTKRFKQNSSTNNSQKELNNLKLSSSIKSLSYNYLNYENQVQEIKYLRVARRIPKYVSSPRRSRNKVKRSRVLSLDKQIKVEDGCDTSIEKSIAHSPIRNLSYSPNKSTQIQSKRINVIPWNIKRKALDEDDEKKYQDYQSYKNKAISEREKKMKKVNGKRKEEEKGEIILKPVSNQCYVSIRNDFNTLTKKYNIIAINEQHLNSMQVYDGFVDLSSLIVADIYVIYYRLVDTIRKNKLSYIQINPFKFKCTKHGYNFDIEILKLEISNSYFIKFKSRAGDILGYRKFAQKLLSQMSLNI
jgi:hypothetical protein